MCQHLQQVVVKVTQSVSSKSLFVFSAGILGDRRSETCGLQWKKSYWS
jgi:hypothetical protein